MGHAMLMRHTATMMRGPLGVDVVVRGVRPLRGLLRKDGSIVADDVGERITITRVLTMAVSDPIFAMSQVVAIDGIDHIVRTPPLPAEDGGLVRYGLVLADPGDGTV